MKFKFILILCIIVLFVSCSNNITKETAEGTGDDIIEKVNQGLQTTADNIADVAPYLKEDITEGFWTALESLEILIEGDSVENIPTPAEILALQLHQGITTSINRSVVNAADKITSSNITDTKKALSMLDEVVGLEIAMNHPPEWIDPKHAPKSDKPFKIQESPSPDDVLEAWTTFSNFSNKPETARKLFSKVEKFVNSSERLNAQAGVIGPVKKSRIGKKANEFLSKLEPGQVSETVKFKNGFLIVQLLEDNGERVEVGYVYIPAKK